jgi:protein tyrosine phosphatase
MIWQEQVTAIVMATPFAENGKDLCSRYWAPSPVGQRRASPAPCRLPRPMHTCLPRQGQKIKCMDMFVRTLATSAVQNKGYLRTLLEIEQPNGETRKVMHFWIHEWVRAWRAPPPESHDLCAHGSRWRRTEKTPSHCFTASVTCICTCGLGTAVQASGLGPRCAVAVGLSEALRAVAVLAGANGSCRWVGPFLCMTAPALAERG